MPMAALADEHLIDRARHGDDEAFERLVERYQSAVYSLCFHLCGDRTEAEDLAQDAFMRFHRQLNRFRTGTSLWPWLRRLTMNSALNGLRVTRRTSAMPSLDDVSRDLDAVAVDAAWRPAADLRIDLEHHLGALAPRDRAMIVLRYLEDLTYAEIAAVLDVPVSTVETRLFRARQRLGARYRAHSADGEVRRVPTSID